MGQFLYIYRRVDMKHEVLVLRKKALLTLLDGMTMECDMTCWKKYLFVVPYGVYRSICGDRDDEKDYYFRCDLIRLADALSRMNDASVSNNKVDGEASFVRHKSGLCFMFVRGPWTTIGTWQYVRKYFRKMNRGVRVKIVRTIERTTESRFRIHFG